MLPFPSRLEAAGIAAAGVASLLTAASLLAAEPLATFTPTSQFKSAVNAQVAAARRVAPELGVTIVELASGAMVYSYHPETPRILASNTKLVTSAAALDRLGPGFFFETEVLLRGKVEDGVLEGDLAVVGGGDPSLSGRQYFGDSYGPFREWATRLRHLGIDRITGGLFLVHGLFDDERVHPEWPRDQLTRWYEAPVEALSFNDNCVLVKVQGNGRPGAPADVEIVPPLGIFHLESSAVTTSRRDRQWVSISRKSGAESHVLTVSGQVAHRVDSVDEWVTVTDPPRYFGAALAAAFAEEGIEIAGPSRAVDVLPSGAASWRRASVHRTDLLTVLEIVNKRSQNLWAESVLKLLGARLCGEGSWASGRRAIEEFLAEIGIGAEQYSLADGSGMSRGNRFAPAHLTALLEHMFRHTRAGEFLRTLPYSGERDLRWERRLSDPPYAGNVMAKTGYLRGVSTLSGYAKARSGRLYAFSILCNGIASKSAAEAAQDRVVRALVDHG